MVISTSGYYSTGSSAIFAVLMEYESCTPGVLKNRPMKSYDYENLLLYVPDGMFDLEDKILIGNNVHRSDEAIRSFEKKMKQLYDNSYIWMGSFRKLLGPEWQNFVEEFINEITQYRVDARWYEHYSENQFNLRKFLGSIKRTILGREIPGDFAKMPAFRCDEHIRYSMVSPSEFYSSAQKLVSGYFSCMRGEEKDKHLILNHFLLPHNAYRIPNYMGEDFRLIIVDRDPRDVFVMEKYRHRTDHSALPCDNVVDFVNYWKRLREIEKKIDDDRVLRIRFEDLMYKHEETVMRMEEVCGLSPDSRQVGSVFSLEKSILNTQLFKQGDVWAEEIKYIEEHLAEYLYDFPADYQVPPVDQNKFGVIY